MRSPAVVNGSSTGLAALFRLENTVGFLTHRQKVIHLVPTTPAPQTGYVWKRVFLRARNTI